MTPQQQASLGVVNGTTPDPSQAPSSGGFLGSLLPMGGSLLGGAVGSALGPLGMIGGSALGSALGRGFENSSGGTTGGMGNAALEGAAGGALGLGAGAVLGKLGEGLGGLAAKGGDAAAAKASTAETQNLIHEFGQAMPTADEQTARGLGDSVQLAKGLGVDTANPGTAKGMLDLSNSVTGPGGTLNFLKQSLLKQAGTVDMSNLPTVLRNAVENNVGDIPVASTKIAGATTTPAAKLYADINPGKTGAPMSTNTDPMDAFHYTQTLGAKLGDAKSALATQVKRSINGTPDPALQANVKALQDAYNGTKSLVYNRPQLNELVKNFKTTPEEIAAGNPAIKPTDPVATHLASTINDAQGVQDLLNEESKFVGMGQVARDATRTNTQAVATPKTMAADETAAGGANNAFDESMARAAAMAGGHHTLIPAAISKVFKNPAAIGKIAGAGGKLLNSGGVKGGAAQAVAQLIAHAPDMGSSNQSLTGAIGGAGMPPGTTQAGANTLANGGAQNNSALLSQLDAMLSADPNLASSLAPVIQQLTGQAQAANAAQGELGQYENTLQAAGGGQGPLQGILSRIGGLATGGAANQVAPQQAALQQLLAKAGLPGMQLPGLYGSSQGNAAGFAPAQSALAAIGGQ